MNHQMEAPSPAELRQRGSVAGRAANQDTVYRIGSITKMFTATMLEQLVEAGKVQITDPVEKYFPEVLVGTLKECGKLPSGNRRMPHG